MALVAPRPGAALRADRLWLCDRRGCLRRVPLDKDPATGRSNWQPLEAGWWECRGVHLCPKHNPEEVSS